MKLNRTITINKESLKTFASRTPQVCVLAKMIGEMKKDKVDEETIEKTVNSAKWVAELKTRQSGYLIFRYYRKVLVEAGVIAIDGLLASKKVVTEAFADYRNDWCEGWMTRGL